MKKSLRATRPWGLSRSKAGHAARTRGGSCEPSSAPARGVMRYQPFLSVVAVADGLSPREKMSFHARCRRIAGLAHAADRGDRPAHDEPAEAAGRAATGRAAAEGECRDRSQDQRRSHPVSCSNRVSARRRRHALCNKSEEREKQERAGHNESVEDDDRFLAQDVTGVVPEAVETSWRNLLHSGFFRRQRQRDLGVRPLS